MMELVQLTLDDTDIFVRRALSPRTPPPLSERLPEFILLLLLVLYTS